MSRLNAYLLCYERMNPGFLCCDRFCLQRIILLLQVKMYNTSQYYLFKINLCQVIYNFTNGVAKIAKRNHVENIRSDHIGGGVYLLTMS